MLTRTIWYFYHANISTYTHSSRIVQEHLQSTSNLTSVCVCIPRICGVFAALLRLWCGRLHTEHTALDLCSLVDWPVEVFILRQTKAISSVYTLVATAVVKLYCSVISSLHISSIRMSLCVCVCLLPECSSWDSKKMYANRTETKTESSVTLCFGNHVWTKFQMPPVTPTETQTHSKVTYVYVCICILASGSSQHRMESASGKLPHNVHLSMLLTVYSTHRIWVSHTHTLVSA